MIPIQNIYYMLSYAFQILNEQGYKNIATERFNNTAELMAAILEKGIAIQLKRGLGKEYISQTEALSSLRGKIDIAESIKTQSMLRKQLICTYDEFSVNSIMNRIIKSTVELLLRSNISKQRKKNLGKLMVYFSEVDFIDLHTINWNVQYNRNNQTYRMLISICYLVVKGLIQTQSDGSTKLMDFLGVEIHNIENSLFGAEPIPADAIMLNAHQYAIKKKNNADKGQRIACGCMVSKDIGEYNTCPHLCEYCYANTSKEAAVRNWKNHKENALSENITGK